MTEEHLERELKFDVPDGWQLPALTTLLPEGASLVRDSIRLETAYVDTGDLALVRSGVSLRRRTGDADTGWHLKVPAGDDRLEIREPLDRATDEVPAELLRVTRGLRADAPLRLVAELVTQRAVHRIVGGEDRALVEIAVDEVRATAVGEAAVISTWREVEVELGDGEEDLLARVAARLRDAGARPAESPSKIVRALGDLLPMRAQWTGLAALVARYLDEQYVTIVANDVALRRGRDVVHKTRTATRRYRSALRVFAGVMDADRAALLDRELQWYAEALGGLRDRHVLRARLDAAIDELPPELVLGPVRDRIHHRLAAELAEAEAALDEVMASERYFALLRELRTWREAAPLSNDVPAGDAGRFLRRARRKVRRRARAAAAAEGRDDAMHDVRKAAKRLRYTAELVEPEVGKAARKAEKRAKRVQEQLGDRQDAVIAADLLLRTGRAAGTTAGESGFTYGLLWERQRAAAQATDDDVEV